MPETPINFDTLKGKIENDNDWREGVDAYRKWTDAEIEQVKKGVHDIKVWKKHQKKEESKIQGEIL